MKKIISVILEILLFIIGIPFCIVDIVWRNRVTEFVLKSINKAIRELNWWRVK